MSLNHSQDDRIGSTDQEEPPTPNEGRGHSHWLMIACCIPMLALAVILVASGAPIGTLVIAIACTAMMAFMMIGMMRG